MPDTLTGEPPAAQREHAGPTEHGLRGRRTAALLWGIALILAGLLWLGEMLGLDIPWSAVIPAAVIVVGLVLMVGAWTGAHPSLIALGLILAVISAVTVTFEGPFTVGDRTYRPSSVAELEESYALGVGSFTIDLRDIDFPMDATEVEVQLNVGDVRILLPDDVTVGAEADVGIGDLRILDRHESGIGPSLEVFDDPPGDQGSLSLVVNVGIGNVKVER